jgi:NADH:ubiquinone oxidoreductase subunit 6 (subunit J)
MPFDPSAIPFFQVAFWAMTFCAIGGAIGVVSSRNLFHSALFLILSLFGVGGYYVLLSAGFLAVVQLLVYIGAIVVLILFAIMFSHRMMEPGEGQTNRQWWISLPIAFILFFILYGVVTTFIWPTSETGPSQDTVLQLGHAFLGSYLIPFMVVSILLSVTLIGAIFLAREKTDVEEAAQ